MTKTTLAVIQTGGKQYLVSQGQKVKIEKLPQKEGDKVIFDKVLLTAHEGKMTIGQPFVEKARVEGKILKQGRGEKLIIFKYKPKKRYKVKKGHRQAYTEVLIRAIRI